MSFSAKVVADSKNEFGDRITTMVVTFPRFILAEFNTHRMFSRNSASSRAIPFEKLIQAVTEHPFVPIAWQKNHKGMQGTEYFDTTDIHLTSKLEAAWLDGRRASIEYALKLAETGVTKQIINRMMEPYMWHTAIVTATEWENFFALRCPKYVATDGANKVYFRSKLDLINWLEKFPKIQEAVMGRTEAQWFEQNESGAEIHMQRIAELMWDAYNESAPKEIKAGDWHVPFGDQMDEHELYAAASSDPTFQVNQFISKALPMSRIKVATARCAQVSYTIVGEEGKPMDYQKLFALHDKLAKSGHWSPFEHCAQAMNVQEYELNVRGKLQWTGGMYDKPLPVEGAEGWSGNFRGFIQYRKTFANENITK